jgi:hypothetical protein
MINRVACQDLMSTGHRSEFLPSCAMKMQFNLGGNSKQREALEDGRAASVLRAITSPPPPMKAAGGFWIKGESKRENPLTPSLFH